MRRLILGIPALILAIIAGAWFWLLHTESGARWIWSQVKSATDGALSSGDISGDLGSGLVGNEIRFVGDSVTVSVARTTLAIDVDLVPLRITVLPASVTGLRIDLAEGRESGEDADIRDTLAKLQLPVELVFTRIDVDGFDVYAADGAAAFVLDSISANGIWRDAISVANLDIRAALFAATGNVRLELQDDCDVQVDLDLIAQPALTGFDSAIPITTTIQGPLDQLTVQARADEPRAFLRGQVGGIASGIQWDLQLDVPALDLPSAANEFDVPPLELVATGRGDIREFEFEAEVGFAGTDMRVNVAANVDIESAAVSSDLDWQQAHWPIGDSEPQFQSHTGEISLSGSLDDWSVAGTVAIEVPTLPPGQLTIDGGGDRDGASVEILSGNVLGGTISGRAEYSWRESRPYSAQLVLKNIQTATVLPEWPAVLSGNASANGQQEPFRISATLADVNGTFDERSLQAAGRVDIVDDSVSVDDFRVQHGKTIVLVDGELYSPEGLRFDVFVDDFGHYVEDTFGSISTSGSVSLKSNAQFLRIDASSDEAGWRDFRITDLAINDRGDGILYTDISVGSIEFGSLNAGQLNLQARIGRHSQNVDIEMQSDELRSTLSVNGAIDSWESPSSWIGQLKRLEIAYGSFSSALDDPADIQISRQIANIERFCLVGSGGMNSCLDVSWNSNTGLELSNLLSAVPVELVNAFVETGLTFEQVVSGDFAWRMQPDGSSSGRGELAMTAGEIASDRDPDLVIETGPAKLGFDLDGDSLRGGQIYLPFPGLGQVAAELEVLDVADEGGSEIVGLVDVDLDNARLLPVFVPAIDDATGQVTLDLDIGGRVGAPLVSGELTLENGSLSYLPIGLRLTDIELSSELQENGDVELAGSFRAGDGRAEIRTRADHALTPTKGVEITLQGENLTIIDVPDVRAVADTDLRVNFNGETLDLNGSITIPQARITPTNLGSARIYESDDVLIVAGKLPEDPSGEGADVDLNFSGSVEVSLGDDVVVDLDIVETQVTGSTVFTWAGDPIPNALGRYDIGGEILAFGQRLEITEGTLRFDDVPADNPYLRIRAEREIFGNTEVRRAGVLVAGDLARPTIEPYTTPVTTEERALTLLVTGSDFDFDQGVGAVDIGTYVAPRIFVSYGIALFDDENVVRVRYDLRRGFGVTLTSGGRAAGADLSYRFEN